MAGLDTVNFWIDGCNISGGKPFEILHCLSEITKWENDKFGYGFSGKCLNYNISVSQSGISLKGSLAKSFYGENITALTRRTTQQAVEKLSDLLHTDIKTAKVTRLDAFVDIPTKYPPANYYRGFGNKPYFKRLLSTPDTLYYNTVQRQIIFYDKLKEAAAKSMKVPETFDNLLRYELRYIECLKKHLKIDVTASTLYDVEFYHSVMQNLYKEFQSIQKPQNQNFMIMTDNISTTKDAETALFAALLQEKGQSIIDEYLADLKAQNTFKERQRYYELKRKLNAILQSPKGEQSDLITELETAIFNAVRNVQ